MPTDARSLSVALTAALVVGACPSSRPAPHAPRADAGATAPVANPPRSAAALSAFGTEAEFRSFMARHQQRRERLIARLRARAQRSTASNGAPQPAPTPTAAAPAQAAQAEAGRGNAPGTAVGGDSITNNQVQGVDEGDIVKTHGDHLVVLRRGRLFTVRLGREGIAPTAMTNAWAPGAPPADWYDEMLVQGDSVLVVGYSYRAGGTEVNRFAIDPGGRLAYRDTLFVRSGDYYSSRNYASRVVGRTLVTYMPVPLTAWRDGREAAQLPAVRWDRDGAWHEAMDFTHLYRPLQDVGWSPMVHTVMFCDLAAPRLACRAEGIIGPAGRTFYVSGSAVYVWVGGGPYTEAEVDPGAPRAPAGAVVYRFPLDGGAPGAVRARGGPTDQFSFHEANGTLHVLLRSGSHGDGMWGPEVTDGDVGLLRVPVGRFDADVAAMPSTAYVTLPRAAGDGWMFQNRFVGDHVLYGTGSTWVRAGERVERAVHVHGLRTGRTTPLALPHGVDRIEALGRDAVVVGTDGRDLHFSSVALDAAPALVDRYTRPNAAQGETRSHGFFYLPEGARRGVVGLPIRGGAEAGWRQLREGSAEVVFLQVDGLRFAGLGGLRAEAERVDASDGCVASCADWYGNARPIFWRGRVFALMGYELVEGRLGDGRVTEVGRVDYHRALAAR